MLNIAKNASARGFIKILQTDLATGVTSTLVEKPNMILYSGADLMAYAITGYPNAKISHMYVSYMNSVSGVPSPNKQIELSNTAAPITAYTTPYGYTRIPLAYNPSFIATANHQHNTPIFTVSVGTPSTAGGVAIEDGTSWFFEVALVAALNSNDAANDVIFSRAQFTPVRYNSSYALTLQWGVEFKAS